MGLIDEVARALLGQTSAPVPPVRINNTRVHHRPVAGGVLVPRTIQPLWMERHWTKAGNRYQGFYRTPYGSCEGWIDERYQGLVRFFIKNPPSGLERHSHYRCFIPQGGGNYEVHFSRPARTASDGIVQIEKILAEAHRLRD